LKPTKTGNYKRELMPIVYIIATALLLFALETTRKTGRQTTGDIIRGKGPLYVISTIIAGILYYLGR
jgi:hypothetical protein